MARRQQGTTDERKLKAALAGRDLELVSVDERLPDGSIAATANKLHLVSAPGVGPIYAPIPVALRIRCDAKGAVRTLTGDTPDARAIADATRFVKSLVDNNKVADAERPAPPGATHHVAIDAKGRPVLRRSRFSAA